MTAAILMVTVLLLLGVALRTRFRVFQWLYIPASVIAGLIGLLVVQACYLLSDLATSEWLASVSLFADRPLDLNAAVPMTFALSAQAAVSSCVATLQGWPGFLIAVVFAGMLLERKPSPLKDSVSHVGRQGLMVWIIVLGQTAVGLLATWLLIQPTWEVPNSFGMLIETGFAGGHGTAAAMGKVYASDAVGFDSGLDLGILMATGGLIYGVITGILWINIAVRLGWVTKAKPLDSRSGSARRDEAAIGYAKVGSETIDPLLLQIIWLTLAVGLGMLMQLGVTAIATAADAWLLAPDTTEGAQQELSKRLSLSNLLDFPLFIYTLFGGWIVRRSLKALGQERAVDRETINRLTSTAMDLLVVAAITSLKLEAVAKLLGPFAVIFAAGAIWCGICLLLISRWVLPGRYWFQLGLINYGMSTGTTATGFVLLRVIDPELESGAAEDYAMAAPLSSPFIGGGMITVALPLLLLERTPIWIPAVAIAAVVVALIVVGARWRASSGGHE